MAAIRDTLAFLQRTIPKYAMRNRIILGDTSRPCEKNKVNLHWFSMGSDPKKENVGDYLSTVVTGYIMNQWGLSEDAAVSKTRHLYAIGSILQAGWQNATVWGSGFLADPCGSTLGAVSHSSRFRKLDVRAVRGPLTRQALLKLGHSCPEIYGDPAILMPLIYQPPATECREYTVVGHYADKSLQKGDTLQVLTSDYKGFIDILANSKKVVSSSLHGVILAESYGVPAVLYSPEGLGLPLYKYEDYYLGTGRTSFPVARSVGEALETKPCPLPELETQRQRLMEAFPSDLWK